MELFTDNVLFYLRCAGEAECARARAAGLAFHQDAGVFYTRDPERVASFAACADLLARRRLRRVRPAGCAGDAP